MDKIIKLVFNTSPKKRGQVRSNCELYSHDKNNNCFEIRINNLSLTTESVIATFKFVKSNKYWETTGVIENNIIKIKFDTSLITQDEQVNCYLILKDSEKRSDIYAFNFDVKMSEYDLKDNLPIKERYFSNSVVVDRVDVLTKEDLKKQAERIEALENKADKDTVYDDSDLKKRVKTLEDNPVVDIKNLATKKALEDYALKTEIPQPYNDTDVTTRLTALENRPAGSGGNVDEDIKNRVTALEDKFVKDDGENIDLKNLVTAEELDYQFINRNTSAAIIQADKDIETFFLENTDRKDVDKIQVRGYVYSFAGETKIFKQKNGDDLEFVGFQGAMITLANVLPKDYDNYTFNDPEKRVTLLTDRNFKEMIATPEFKAVVKESLREIVKEILREEN